MGGIVMFCTRIELEMMMGSRLRQCNLRVERPATQDQRAICSINAGQPSGQHYRTSTAATLKEAMMLADCLAAAKPRTVPSTVCICPKYLS